MRYAVVIEKGPTSFGTYVPDLSGCVAVGDSVDEVKEGIVAAVALHLECLREDGLPTPEAETECDDVTVYTSRE